MFILLGFAVVGLGRTSWALGLTFMFVIGCCLLLSGLFCVAWIYLVLPNDSIWFIGLFGYSLALFLVA